MARMWISKTVPLGIRYGPMRTSFIARRRIMGNTGRLRIDSCIALHVARYFSVGEVGGLKATL